MGRYYYRFAGDPRYYAYDWQGIPPGGSRAAETKQLGDVLTDNNIGPGIAYPPLDKGTRCPPKRPLCLKPLSDCYTGPAVHRGPSHVHEVACGDTGAIIGTLTSKPVLLAAAVGLYLYFK